MPNSCIKSHLNFRVSERAVLIKAVGGVCNREFDLVGESSRDAYTNGHLEELQLVEGEGALDWCSSLRHWIRFPVPAISSARCSRSAKHAPGTKPVKGSSRAAKQHRQFHPVKPTGQWRKRKGLGERTSENGGERMGGQIPELRGWCPCIALRHPAWPRRKGGVETRKDCCFTAVSWGLSLM